MGLNEYSELLKDLNAGLNPETRFVRLSDTVTTHLQGPRYLKAGYSEVSDIVITTEDAVKEALNSWKPEGCAEVLRKALEKLGFKAEGPAL